MIDDIKPHFERCCWECFVSVPATVAIDTLVSPDDAAITLAAAT